MTVLLRKKYFILSVCTLFSITNGGDVFASKLFEFPEDQNTGVVSTKRQDTPYPPGKKPRIRISTPIKVIKSTTVQKKEEEGQSTPHPIALDFLSDELTISKSNLLSLSGAVEFFEDSDTFNALEVSTDNLDHDCSISPIRPSRPATKQRSPIPLYRGLMTERMDATDISDCAEESVEVHESFERRVYTEEKWEKFYQSLSVGIATVFPPTGCEFTLLDDGYVYELVQGRLAAIFKQSDPEFDWESFLKE